MNTSAARGSMWDSLLIGGRSGFLLEHFSCCFAPAALSCLFAVVGVLLLRILSSLSLFFDHGHIVETKAGEQSYLTRSGVRSRKPKPLNLKPKNPKPTCTAVVVHDTFHKLNLAAHGEGDKSVGL